MQELKITARDGLELSVSLFDVANPVAVMQIVHGAIEYKSRYYEFIEYLNSKNIAVIICDNRGNGYSVNKEFFLGHMDGADIMLDDLYRVGKYLRDMYSDKPFYLFGHSFGSLLVRNYLMNHDDEPKKVVLSGIPPYYPASAFGYNAGKLLIKLYGKTNHNRFFSMGNIVEKKDISWLCTDKNVIEKKMKDPLANYKYDNSANMTIWETNYNLAKIDKFECKNPDLPILVLTGADDPCTGFEKGVSGSIDLLKKIGYNNISLNVYAGLKHEILNEPSRNEIYEYIADFLLNQ